MFDTEQLSEMDHVSSIRSKNVFWTLVYLHPRFMHSSSLIVNATRREVGFATTTPFCETIGWIMRNYLPYNVHRKEYEMLQYAFRKILACNLYFSRN